MLSREQSKGHLKMIRIFKYDELKKDEIFSRADISSSVEGIVADIISKVRAEGDKALIELCKKFDKAELTSLEVTEEETKEAFDGVEDEFKSILTEAAANIRKYHEKQLRASYVINDTEGVVTGQKITPIEKVGIYVPGGTAAYPSTVLMDSIPAKVAGCDQIIMVTPPSADGKVNKYILAAAKIAGVDRIFKTGGAQAVAALAYGTESIPAVDKIVGPGNAFVAEAKKQVFGKVSIDMIAGPSEILIVADKSAKAEYVAADMLSQAEHDKMASAVLVTDCEELAYKVSEEIEKQLSVLPREEIARASIDNNGKIIVVKDLPAAITVSNEIAPEHLELCMESPFDYLDRVKNAGSVFMGNNCPEALGDYFAGPNHTLPTSGSARFSSPLSTDDFIKKVQFTYYTDSALQKVADKVAYFANKEGLDGHARSVLVRKKK